MLWYRLIEFSKSRLGHVTILCAVITVLFFVVAAKLRNHEERKDALSSTLPTLPSAGRWQPGSEEEILKPLPDPILSKPKEGYRPFRPVISEPEERPEPVIIEEPLNEPELVVAVIPLPSLIKSERKSSSKPSPEESPQPEPVSPRPLTSLIEEGALLYCELTAPVTSDQASAPVTARLTRSLVRDGRIILPEGTHLSGSLQSTQGTRLFFAQDWRVQLSSGDWMSIKGHAQEAAFDQRSKRYLTGDGRSGLPGTAMIKPEKKASAWKKTLGTIASAAGRIAQDRVRTNVGEYIPSTGRNVLLEGTSNVIEQYTTPQNNSQLGQQAVVVIEAGRGLYLTVSAPRSSGEDVFE